MNTLLPHKLSDCTDVAVSAFKEILEDDRYVVDMNVYHRFSYSVDVGSKDCSKLCRVCFAGAVIAKRLGASLTEDKFPGMFDEHTNSRLCALDFVRTGKVKSGLDEVGEGENLKRSAFERVVPSYHDDPHGFLSDMTGIAADLRAEGL